MDEHVIHVYRRAALLPPYVVTAEQIGQALALVRRGLQHVSTKVAS